MTDGELARQAMAGRATAYEELVRRHAPRVLAVCHARVSRADTAEELAQESLMRGWRAIATLAQPDRFAAWLCGIATRVCLDWLKSPRRAEVSLSSLAAKEDGHDPADRLPAPDLTAARERDEELRAVVAEVERLPEESREVLMLFYYDDCTYNDIAAALDISAATVNLRLARARALLKQRMNQRSHPTAMERPARA